MKKTLIAKIPNFSHISTTEKLKYYSYFAVHDDSRENFFFKLFQSSNDHKKYEPKNSRRTKKARCSTRNEIDQVRVIFQNQTTQLRILFGRNIVCGRYALIGVDCECATSL